MILGLLLGRKNDNKVEVVDAIPLFHERIVSGPLEIAFDMVESTISEKELKIVGVYEAILVAKSDFSGSPVTLNIAEGIRANHFHDLLMLSVRIPSKLTQINDRHYSKFEIASYTLGASGF